MPVERDLIQIGAYRTYKWVRMLHDLVAEYPADDEDAGDSGEVGSMVADVEEASAPVASPSPDSGEEAYADMPALLDVSDSSEEPSRASSVEPEVAGTSVPSLMHRLEPFEKYMLRRRGERWISGVENPRWVRGDSVSYDDYESNGGRSS